MSKGLEELKKIKNYKEWTTVVTMGGYEQAKVKLAYNDELKASFSIVEKELKALEIIKEKPQATLWLFQHCDKKMEYEDMISLFKEDITKEQFDLLKEVLL